MNTPFTADSDVDTAKPDSGAHRHPCAAATSATAAVEIGKPDSCTTPAATAASATVEIAKPDSGTPLAAAVAA
eukprot:1285516-Pleurochrysis_carterae.AAC.1